MDLRRPSPMCLLLPKHVLTLGKRDRADVAGEILSVMEMCQDGGQCTHAVPCREMSQKVLAMCFGNVQDAETAQQLSAKQDDAAAKRKKDYDNLPPLVPR